MDCGIGGEGKRVKGWVSKIQWRITIITIPITQIISHLETSSTQFICVGVHLG